MAGVIKIGEPEIETYRNLVTQPVPYGSGQVTASWYTPNPNPNAVVSYLLDQLDGPTTGYGQYLEDYARITVPLLTGGSGTEEDPFYEYFYPHPVLQRRRVNITAADFEGYPYINTRLYFRLPVGVTIRSLLFWYNSSNSSLLQQYGPEQVTSSADWRSYGVRYTTPSQNVLNNAAYVQFGIEIRAGMTAAQNWWDTTGFRLTPVRETDFNDFRGEYWDGSTDFPSSGDTAGWVGTPRNSGSTLTRILLAGDLTVQENFRGLTMDEDVTGLDAANISGGTSQARITIPLDNNRDSYLGLGAEVQETALGNFFGRVRDTDEDETAGSVALTLDESLSLLNAWVTAPPQSGTLASVVRNWAALAQAPLRPFVFEDGTGTIPVNAPGFVGNLYDKMRELLAAYQVEMVTVNGNHVVRKPLQDIVILDNFSEPPKVVSNLQETAQYVRVHWYDNEFVENAEVYPLAKNPQEDKEDVPEPTIYSVGAAETLKVDIQLRASLLTVNQPTYVAFVPNESVSGVGVYTAVGTDNLPITPAQWAAGGGSLTVNISPDDPSVVQVTIVGPDFPNLAPFRIAMSSGSGNYYNALHITGTGMLIRDQWVDLPTGALPSATGQEFAVECTNPFISSRTQAYQAGAVIAGRVQQSQTISSSIPTPNQPGANVLGTLPGAKFRHGSRQFRIETTSVGQDVTTITGVYALTSADFDRYFGGASGSLTSGEFDALYDGATPNAMNFSLKPLLHRRSEV
jgi:hypothetical protein